MLSLDPQDGERATVAVEARGAGDDDEGVVVELVVEHLAIVGGKGSKVPTVRVKRISIRAQITLQATFSFSDRVWTAERFKASIKRWAAPGVLSKTAARAVLTLVLPTLRDLVRKALPPELGQFALALRGPCVVAGEFDARSAPSGGPSGTVGSSEGGVAAATRRCRGDEPRRCHGRDVDILWRRVAADARGYEVEIP